MSTSSTSRRLLRRLTLGSGPLKRRSDRLELLCRIMLTVALLAAVPLGVATGNALAGDLSATAAARAGDLVQERATLLRDAAPEATGADDTVATVATWAVPGGAAQVGTVPAPPGARAGTSVPVWLDRTGQPTRAPTSSSEIVDQALVAGAVTVLATVIAGLSLHLVAVWLLGRQRARRWAAGWQLVEPVWVTRFR